ncbi:hypothetical protein B0I03_101320 [Flavobacterium aquaticum]|uniref:Phage derived Gp49-like protein DUF891 n=1 Tax=Flavobacterium aquaticum TaxID=1236486 RepID=A0A327Z434_9FLAO|nr:hypothetical protein [Flavobacterium aquaticum]RAK25159.1 hypothetical protein B0I03_101320 [Flavobacterium aquaticum]
MKKAREILKSEDSKRIICIDVDNWEEIFNYVNQDDKHKKKFKYICNIILEGHKNTDVYDKEDIDSSCKNVTAMKFFKGNSNDRIYCKEISMEDKTFVVIACKLFEKKKSQGNNKKNKPIIKNIGKSEYEIIRKEIK